MNYQLGRRIQGVRENIALINCVLSSNIQTALDVGCNEGLVSCYLDSMGINVVGLEAQSNYLETAKNFARSNFNSPTFENSVLTLSEAESLPNFDAIFYLSVNQQVTKETSLENSNLILIELFKKTNFQLFFQPCMIHKKYGGEQPFIENDILSAKAYFDSVLSRSGIEYSSELVGIAHNMIPPSEPFRPLFLYTKVKSKSGESRNISHINEVENAAQIRGSLVSIDLSSGVCSRDLQCFDKVYGWHRFIALSDEVFKASNSKSTNLNVNELEITKYYSSFSPKTYKDVWLKAGNLTDIGVLGNMPLNQYCNWFPWVDSPDTDSDIEQGVSRLPGIPEWDRHAFGPMSEEAIYREVERIAKLLATISKQGYSPEVSVDGYIRGVIMKKDQERRFLVYGGQHRAAILSYLEYKTVVVKIQPQAMSVIDVKDVETWPMVRRKIYTVEQAINIFEGVFNASGQGFKLCE